MPASKEMQCRGCRHADLTLTTLPTCRAAANYANQLRTVTIWCRKRHTIVKYPYEKCSTRETIPPLTLTSFIQ